MPSGSVAEAVPILIPVKLSSAKLVAEVLASDNFFKVLWNNTLRDELDKDKINGDYDHMRQFKFNHKDIKAFSILGISVGLKWKKVQDKFKLLVKKYHPDINAGNKKYEEKLKLITLAYTQLKNTYRDKIDTKS